VRIAGKGVSKYVKGKMLQFLKRAAAASRLKFSGFLLIIMPRSLLSALAEGDCDDP